MNLGAGAAPRRRRAFTLVELLVVIGIIALLIGILMPALGRAREQAKAVVCLSQLRQLGAAFVMYVNQSNGTLPSADTCGPLFPWGSTRVVGWVDGTNTVKAIENGALYPFVGNTAVYRCPSEGNDKRMRTYSMNAYLNTQDTYPVTVKYKIRKMNQMRRPTECLIFAEETDPRDDWNMNGFWQYPMAEGSAYDAAFGDPVAAWHAGGANFAFGDGHAEAWKWNDQRTTRLLLDTPDWPATKFNTPNNPDLTDLRRALVTWGAMSSSTY